MCRCAERREAIADAWNGKNNVLTSANIVIKTLGQDIADGSRSIVKHTQSALDKYLSRRGLK